MKYFKMNIFITFITILMFILTKCSSFENYVPRCCILSIPKPQLTGQKTALECQIIGEYRELEKDAWIISSVKTNVQKGEGFSIDSVDDDKLYLAMKIREFHENKIRIYKGKGAIGEMYNGLIAYRSHPEYEGNRDLKNLLLTVIEEENKARREIFERILIRSGIEKPTNKDIKAFGRIFAEEQRALAMKNDWIQDKSGRWIRKR